MGVEMFFEIVQTVAQLVGASALALIAYVMYAEV